LLSILTLVVSGVGLVWWLNQGAHMAFNGSWPDWISEIYALTLCGIGLLALLIRHPEGWGSGVVMLLVLTAGHIANLLFPLAGKDYQGAVRLAEMIAFPILLTLPQRVTGLAVAISPGVENEQARRSGPSVPLLQALLDQSTADSPSQVLPGVCGNCSGRGK
jgi:hypothetical protein